MDEFLKLEPIELREPGPRARATMDAHGSTRGMPKDKLQPVDGLCAWCEKLPVKKRRGKYCSPDCNNSALFNCYPQVPMAKAFILIKIQGCACARCGLSYEEEIAQKISRIHRDQTVKPEWAGSRWKPDPVVTYHRIGYGTGHKWHVDHIHPIHKGGAGAGLGNVQVLCVPCHKDKTREDLIRRDQEAMWEE